MSNRILILGASGFIGNTIYKELLPYFDVYGTYATKEDLYLNNQVFYQFKVEENSIYEILNSIEPSVIISSFKGTPKDVYNLHEVLCAYCLENDCKLIFISSATVFDAKGDFPSFEKDTTRTESIDGKLKVSIEKLLLQLPRKYWAILRLPLVLGVNSPAIIQLKQAIKHHATFEVFPNLIVSATTQNKFAQQIHYIINKNLSGIFHLSSNDVMHHEELFKEISEKIHHKKPIFKSVYSSNEDQFLAILPKNNTLPKNYQITIEEVIKDSILKDEIETLKALT